LQFLNDLTGILQEVYADETLPSVCLAKVAKFKGRRKAGFMSARQMPAPISDSSGTPRKTS